MTLQQIIETIPHGLLEQVAKFTEDPDRRNVTIHKQDGVGKYKLESLRVDFVK